jgi:protein arginine N-methyltransferase 2
LTDSSTLLLHATDETASGSSDAFLKSKLRYKVVHGQHICVLDVNGEEIGVMMGWEKDIMRETVKKLCLDHPKASELKVLNVGFGLGIVSPFFQTKKKRIHARSNH